MIKFIAFSVTCCLLIALVLTFAYLIVMQIINVIYGISQLLVKYGMKFLDWISDNEWRYIKTMLIISSSIYIGLIIFGYINNGNFEFITNF